MQNLVQGAEVYLKNFIRDDQPSWFGPFYIAVVDHLEISIGPLLFDVPETELTYGDSISIPTVSLDPLFDWAFRHPEVYNLFRTVTADLVLRPQNLPEKVRLFAWLVLTGKVKEPKAPKQSSIPVPSSKTFLRDFAICQALAQLGREFDLPPTHNMANTGISGASVVHEALVRMGHNIGVSSVNVIWTKRSDIDDVKKLALREIKRLPSVMPR